jgi:hypothetical protein
MVGDQAHRSARGGHEPRGFRRHDASGATTDLTTEFGTDDLFRRVAAEPIVVNWAEGTGCWFFPDNATKALSSATTSW